MTLLKGLVIALLLANVGYLLWSRGVGSTVEPPAPASGVGTLRLASEGRAVMPSPGASSGGATGSNQASSGYLSTGPELRGAAPAGAGAPAPGRTGIPAAGGRDASPPALLTNVKRCISVGPFRDVSEAAHAATLLRGGGYDPRQRVADGEVWSGVWVYVPIPPGRGTAEQMLVKLKSGGIEDALQMPGPNDAAVISLGLYVEPKRAQARVAQAQALGFNPGVSDRKRNGNVYWIDIDLKPTDPVLNPADLQGESGRLVRVEVKGCPAGAAS